MPGRVTATPVAPRLAVSVGETVAGKYAVEQVLGAGGMGAVVRARHLVLGSRVALKFMHPELLGDAEMRTRFGGEALRVSQMQSEHVARVLDVGELPNGVPYIVMEYVEGRDLSSLLKERGPLSAPEAVDYLMQACEAIAEAHGRGIVHRDIKPANLYVARRLDGTALVKVLDFGIAKTLPSAAAGDAAKLTKTYATMGSPYYSAPEQLESASFADPRSDIWALGVTLHELLTAQGPFEGGSQASLITAIMTRPPFPLRHARPDLPEDLEWVIARCLEKDPNRRFRRVVELAECLVSHGTADAAASLARIAGIPGQDRRSTVAVPSSGAPPPFAPTPPAPPASRIVTPTPAVATRRRPSEPTVAFHMPSPGAGSGSRWAIIFIVGALALLSAAVAAFLWFRSPRDPPPLPPPPATGAPPPVVLEPPGPRVTPR